MCVDTLTDQLQEKQTEKGMEEFMKHAMTDKGQMCQWETSLQ